MTISIGEKRASSVLSHSALCFYGIALKCSIQTNTQHNKHIIATYKLLTHQRLKSH